jgi:putative transcriptional regulator
MFNPENIENEFFHRIGFNFDPKSLVAGSVLISEPFLADPNFSRSVILLTEYTEADGAFGFILNKPTELEISDIVETFPYSGYTFHVGGPVSSETVFFLHSAGSEINESNKIMDNLYWSGDFEHAKELIDLGKVTPDQIKFFGGYSGWGIGQLEDELKHHSWIIGELNAKQVLAGDADGLWKRSLNRLGKKFSIMAEFPENPELN